LRRQGKVVATELSQRLETSEDTIRRDLRDLAEQNLLQRVHGGALPRSPATARYSQRQGQSSEAKAAIARAATQLFRNGQVILLDGGTTNMLVAQNLPPNLEATVITNSPPIAACLAEHAFVEVVMVGGRLYKESLVTTGAATLETLNRIRADIYIMGVCSLHPEVGITTPNLEEAYIKRAMVAGAAEVVALASPEKIGTAAPYLVGPITEITYLITEKSVPAEVLAAYSNLGITVITA
jgi:DeoR/GlpR family transcriptional regulator of sugar metabolism